jgi:hypothetical protein
MLSQPNVTGQQVVSISAHQGNEIGNKTLRYARTIIPVCQCHSPSDQVWTDYLESYQSSLAVCESLRRCCTH